jgi:riboflavin kinase/FMN adenylyltransferase
VVFAALPRPHLPVDRRQHGRHNVRLDNNLEILASCTGGPLKPIRDLDTLSPDQRCGAVTIGNFDGVHRGHALIIERLVSAARRVGGPATVFTFDPHPAALLQPSRVPAALTWLERKVALLRELQVDLVVAYPTTREILNLSPESFFERVVQEQLAAKAMVEGANFHFGRQRSGNVEVLDRLCQESGLTLEIVQPLIAEGEVVSSSRIRKLIQAGKLADANALLCHPFRIRGRVVRGAGRGRSLGFPTANIETEGMVLPPPGVYAGRAIVAGDSFATAINIGANPTFGEQIFKFECFLIGFQGELYDHSIEIEFVSRLRDICVFDSVDLLKQQLTRDVAAAEQAAGELTDESHT